MIRDQIKTSAYLKVDAIKKAYRNTETVNSK